MIPVLFAALFLGALDSEANTGSAVLRLHVEPMPGPKPALKYQLLPEVRELKTGNAAQQYLKCFMEQRIAFFSPRGVAERSRYQSMTLSELAAAKVGDYGGNALRQADAAARMISVDWQTIPLIQAGGSESPPAELGPLQVLAVALGVKLRAQVAEQRYDDALGTAKTIFALGRHLGEYPAALAGQLGMGIVHRGLEGLEEMVQQPGSPNLYWALTDLPRPIVDLRKGVQGDRTRIDAALRPIRGDAPMAKAELETCLGHLSGLIGFARERAGRTPASLRTRLAARVDDREQLASSRKRLIAPGARPALIESLPPLQVILLAEKFAYEIKRDARIKLLGLPLDQLDLPAATDAPDVCDDGLLDELLPDIRTLRSMQGALEREIALLRHVEALRLHAAGHSGRLPAGLSEVSVPLPDDPCTGRPFAYSALARSARLGVGQHRKDGNEEQSSILVEVILRD